MAKPTKDRRVKPIKSLPKDFVGRVTKEDGGVLEYTPINPEKALASGAEGSIFPVKQLRKDGKPLCLKIYHPGYLKKDNNRIQKKIEAMTATDHMNKALLPNDRYLLDHTSHPLGAVYSKSNKFLGYVMNYFEEVDQLSIIQNKVTFSKFQNINYRMLVRASLELTRNVSAIHKAGYIIGDMNPKNFVVARDLTVYAVDVDSFQFESQNVFYRTSGRLLEWLHPDLHMEDWPEIEIAPEHDCFTLAKLIFQLLTFGENPFAAIYEDSTREVNGANAVRQRHYPFNDDRAKSLGISTRPGVIHPKFLSKRLDKLFNRAFLGSLDEIPTPSEWQYALAKFYDALIECEINPSHFHNKSARCPMCFMEATSKGTHTYYRPSYPNGNYPKIKPSPKVVSKYPKILKSQSSPAVAVMSDKKKDRAHPVIGGVMICGRTNRDFIWKQGRKTYLDNK